MPTSDFIAHGPTRISLQPAHLAAASRTESRAPIRRCSTLRTKLLGRCRGRRRTALWTESSVTQIRVALGADRRGTAPLADIRRRIRPARAHIDVARVVSLHRLLVQLLARSLSHHLRPVGRHLLFKVRPANYCLPSSTASRNAAFRLAHGMETRDALLRYPDKKIVVILLTNRNEGTPAVEAAKIAKELPPGAVHNREPPEPPPQANQRESRRYAPARTAEPPAKLPPPRLAPPAGWQVIDGPTQWTGSLKAGQRLEFQMKAVPLTDEPGDLQASLRVPNQLEYKASLNPSRMGRQFPENTGVEESSNSKSADRAAEELIEARFEPGVALPAPSNATEPQVPGEAPKETVILEAQSAKNGKGQRAAAVSITATASSKSNRTTSSPAAIRPAARRSRIVPAAASASVRSPSPPTSRPCKPTTWSCAPTSSWRPSTRACPK